MPMTMNVRLFFFLFAFFGAQSPAASGAAAASLFVGICGPQFPPPPCVVTLHPLGQPVTFWVIALDAQYGIATNYTGTVIITSSDPSAVLPPPHSYSASDGSIFAFTIAFNSLGPGPVPSSWTVTATDQGNGLTATGTFFVVAAQPAPIPTLSRPLQVVLLTMLLMGLAYGVFSRQIRRAELGFSAPFAGAAIRGRPRSPSARPTR
jgi:hypothetical protein